MSDWFARHSAPFRTVRDDLAALAADFRSELQSYPAGSDELCREVEARLRTLGDDLAAPRFRLPFAGGFSGGKSHTICALLERPGLLPSANRATTGNATELVYAGLPSDEERAEIHYFDREKLARCLESYAQECARIFKDRPALVTEAGGHISAVCNELRAVAFARERAFACCEPVYAFCAGHIADYGLQTRERQVLYNLADLLCAYQHEEPLVRTAARVRQVARGEIASYAAKRDYPWVQDAPRDGADLRRALRLKYLIYHLDEQRQPLATRLGDRLRLGEGRAPEAAALLAELEASLAECFAGEDVDSELREYRQRLSFLLIWKVVLPVCSALLRNGASIIDLPGADAPFPRDEFVARLFLNEADGAVVLSSCLKPLSETDAEVVSILEKVREVDLEQKTFFVFNQYGRLGESERRGLAKDLEASLRVIHNRARIAHPHVFLTDALVAGHLSCLDSVASLKRAFETQEEGTLALSDPDLPGQVRDAFLAAEPGLEELCAQLVASLDASSEAERWLGRLCRDLLDYRAQVTPQLKPEQQQLVEEAERDGGVARLRRALSDFLAHGAARARLAEIQSNLQAVLDRLRQGIEGPGRRALEALERGREDAREQLLGRLDERFARARAALEKGAARPSELGRRVYQVLWDCHQQVEAAVEEALEETGSLDAGEPREDCQTRRQQVYLAALHNLEQYCERSLLAELDDAPEGDALWQEVHRQVIEPFAGLEPVEPLLARQRAQRPGLAMQSLARVRHRRAWRGYCDQHPLPRQKLRGWSRLAARRLKRELCGFLAKILTDVAEALAHELDRDLRWQHADALDLLETELQALAGPWLAEHRPEALRFEDDGKTDPERRRQQLQADLYRRLLRAVERFAAIAADGLDRGAAAGRT